MDPPAARRRLVRVVADGDTIAVSGRGFDLAAFRVSWARREEGPVATLAVAGEGPPLEVGAAGTEIVAGLRASVRPRRRTPRRLLFEREDGLDVRHIRGAFAAP